MPTSTSTNQSAVPKGWWELHGGEAKELQAIARALSKVPSPCNLIIRSGTADVNRKVLGVGAAERTWKAHMTADAIDLISVARVRAEKLA